MIDTKCPSCGAVGRIPSEKVGTRLVCKKCLRVFHVNRDGHSVLGELAPPKNAARPHPPRATAHHHTGSLFDDLASQLSSVKLPRVDLRIVGLIAGMTLFSGLGYWLFSRQTLEKRAEEAARSFVTADMKMVIDLSVPGTEMDTIQWYSALFQEYNELKHNFGGQEAGVIIKPRSDSAGGTAEVELIFSKDGLRFDGSLFSDKVQPNPNASVLRDRLEVPLFWTKDAWGNWRLDGTKTFAGIAGP